MSSTPPQPTVIDPVEIEAILRQMWTGQVLDLLGEPTEPFAKTLAGQAAPEGMDNPYWAIARWMPISRWSAFGSRPPGVEGYTHQNVPVNRDLLVFNYSFAIPSPGDIAFLARHIAGRPVIELGAGTGYWAWQLTQAGVDVVAYDSQEWVNNGRFTDRQFHPVHEGSIERIAEHPDRMLMLCWPDYNTSFALDALNAYAGDDLIYIGEGWGGCTGDEEFGKRLDEEWHPVDTSPHHVNFGGIHSDVGIYRRGPGDPDELGFPAAVAELLAAEPTDLNEVLKDLGLPRRARRKLIGPSGEPRLPKDDELSR